MRLPDLGEVIGGVSLSATVVAICWILQGFGAWGTW